ncbi:unnamed protein product [Rotaria magnacalcarata]|uniref:Uncharacterized protein n=1 Tax=Rotaria magnacalcarata TaxID=392030 RepID=A0A8S2MX16_9BILA|nr:unnamed protein product [Rotaria magnacalcarata]
MMGIPLHITISNKPTMNFSNDTYQTQSNQNSTANDEDCSFTSQIVHGYNPDNYPVTTIENQNDQNLTNSEEQYGQDSGDCIGQVQDTAEIQILIGPSIILTGQDAFISNCSDKLFENLDEKTNVPTSSFNQPQCVKDQPSEDRRLPENVIALFPGQSEQAISTILKNVQDATDEIWSEVDKKYIKRVMSRETTEQMYKDVTQSLSWYIRREFREQANAVYKAQVIMENISYGFMFCNTKNELNSFGVGSPKSPWKLEHTKRGTRERIIGLFIVSVNENKVKFSLKDTKENKVVEWLKIDDIIQNNPGSRRDIYVTLRPFIKYVNKHPIH